MMDIEIEIKFEFEDPFKFSKSLSREEKISVIVLTGEDLLTPGFLRTFKPSV